MLFPKPFLLFQEWEEIAVINKLTILIWGFHTKHTVVKVP